MSKSHKSFKFIKVKLLTEEYESLRKVKEGKPAVQSMSDAVSFLIAYHNANNLKQELGDNYSAEFEPPILAEPEPPKQADLLEFKIESHHTHPKIHGEEIQLSTAHPIPEKHTRKPSALGLQITNAIKKMNIGESFVVQTAANVSLCHDKARILKRKVISRKLGKTTTDGYRIWRTA